LYDHLKPDTEGNIEIHAPVVLHDCKGTLVHTTSGKLVVASGLEDFIVVCENDAVLIFPKEKEQEIKQLRNTLKEKGLDKYL
jgi:mannose-1-phosphate guanylyltransferase